VRRLVQHIVLFAVINAFLVVVWYLVGGGSTEVLKTLTNHPDRAVVLEFWPIWPILSWGVLLLIHAGFTLSNLVFGGPHRRRRRRERHAATGMDLGKKVVAAIDDAHERHMANRGKAAEVTRAAPSRKWVTVMFCDVADSTHHNERLGDEEWHRVLAEIRSVARAALAQRGGSEVGTQGDGMLARFESPADAVLCGVDIQSELGIAREANDFVPEVRIGVHAGDVVEEEGDLVGRVINLASRVTGEAIPGEILVTEPVADQLVGKLELEDKGLRTLKGLAQPRHLLAVRWGGVERAEPT